MKLLVIGIDAMMPDILFDHIEDYPTLHKLAKTGTSGSYDGYVYGYGSHDNWTSMYTGVSPKEHQIVKGIYQPKKRLPRLYDYSHFETIWKVLNNNGYEVGIWKGLATSPPESIDGFMISGELPFDDLFNDPEIALEGNMLVDKDKYLNSLFEEEFPPLVKPKGPQNFGYRWEQVYKNPELINEILDEHYFSEGVQYLKDMLDYSLINIEKVLKEKPVDLFWFYNGIFDYIGHFTFHDKTRTQIKEAFKVVDKFVEKLLDICQPENVLFISDHGQKSYIDHFPNCSIEIQKEAFGLADQCILTGDNIVMEARAGGFLSSFHSLKGTMIVSGEKFKQGELKNVRNLDIYPLILELFDCEIPKDRIGLIPDIFKGKQIKNASYLFKEKQDLKKVLFIQTCEVNVFNSYINDYYNENRFTEIFMYGPEKYRSIFEANDQVKGYVSHDENYDAASFDEILVPYDNKRSKELEFIRVK